MKKFKKKNSKELIENLVDHKIINFYLLSLLTLFIALILQH